MNEQRLSQAPVGPHPGQRVQLVPVGGDILAVLVVQFRHGLHPAPKLLALILRSRRFRQFDGGVLLDQLLNVLIELQGAHL